MRCVFNSINDFAAVSTLQLRHKWTSRLWRYNQISIFLLEKSAFAQQDTDQWKKKNHSHRVFNNLIIFKAFIWINLKYIYWLINIFWFSRFDVSCDPQNEENPIFSHNKNHHRKINPIIASARPEKIRIRKWAAIKDTARFIDSSFLKPREKMLKTRKWKRKFL